MPKQKSGGGGRGRKAKAARPTPPKSKRGVSTKRVSRKSRGARGANSIPGQQEAAALRRRTAFDLRASGLTHQQIGDKLGVSHTAARQYVEEYWTELEALTKEKAEMLRYIEIEELRKLGQRWLPIATAEALDVSTFKDGANGPIHIEIPDYKAGTKAAAIVLKIQERRAKLLGLDSAEKVEHSGKVTHQHLTLAEFDARCKEAGL